MYVFKISIFKEKVLELFNWLIINKRTILKRKTDSAIYILRFLFQVTIKIHSNIYIAGKFTL